MQQTQITYSKVKLVHKGYAGKVYLVDLDSENQNPNNKTATRQIVKKYFKKDINQLPEYLFNIQLSHPNIIKFNSTFVEAKRHKTSVCLMMDVMTPLNELKIKKYQDVQCIFAQLVSAVSYLQEKGIVHRVNEFKIYLSIQDIKPSNIFLTEDGKVKLGDFGIARQVDQQMSPNVCTKNYRAPELFFGCKSYLFGIDSWSLGCTLGEMYIGQMLFNGRSEIEILSNIANVIGNIDSENCSQYKELPHFLEFKGQFNLSKVMIGVPEEGLKILKSLLDLDFKKRVTAKELMENEFIKQGLGMQISQELLKQQKK